jgi:hypothetical protein
MTAQFQSNRGQNSIALEIKKKVEKLSVIYEKNTGA